MKTAGGQIECAQCAAKSKRSGGQCRQPAMKGKRVCRFHGGLSTGPKTDAGKARCAQANTVHGRETRSIRAERAKKLKELAELMALLHMS
ncbi:HGGxSTG domain-containing protein [Cupriavidus necator]|uniref:HGGxSTG domain-containing protein n=1 Tax=Cupriavidus necator TaxID=106590 RepID=UPI003F737CC7